MQEEIKQEINKDKNVKTKKVNVRVILVLAFIILMAIFALVSYRGNYLETIEIGENFKQVFTQDLKYQYITIAVNFVLLFIIITIVNKGRMVVSLRSRILFGYIILVAVIGSMAAILIHEPAKFHDLYAYVE